MPCSLGRAVNLLVIRNSMSFPKVFKSATSFRVAGAEYFLCLASLGQPLIISLNGRSAKRNTNRLNT
jgi:hypothetical protein